MVPKAQIEAKVTDTLKKCNALGKFWQRPITGEQLQAEMDRMVQGSKNPATLKELFAALGNDPTLIAECLARPILADRLIHNGYASDTRFHKEAKEKAEKALKGADPENKKAWPEGDFSRVTYRPEGEQDKLRYEGQAGPGEIFLDEAGLSELRAQCPTPEKITLREEEGAFALLKTVSKSEKEIVLEQLVFKKAPFGAWWAESSRTLSPAVAEGALGRTGYSSRHPGAPRPHAPELGLLHHRSLHRHAPDILPFGLERR